MYKKMSRQQMSGAYPTNTNHSDSLFLLIIELFLLVLLLLLFLLLLFFCLNLWLNHLFVELLLDFDCVGELSHRCFLGCEDLALKVSGAPVGWVVFLVQHIVSIQHQLGIQLLLFLLDVQNLQSSHAIKWRC